MDRCTWVNVHGSMYVDQCTWISVHGSVMYTDRCTWIDVHGSMYMDQCTRVHTYIHTLSSYRLQEKLSHVHRKIYPRV